MSIEIKDLRKDFKNIEALSGINCKFNEGEITGLIGFNGSGKTTTFNIITSLIEKYEGEVLYHGEHVSDDILKQISYLSAGSDDASSEKASEHLLYIAYAFGLRRKEAIAMINDLSREFDFVEYLNEKIKALSKGNQQKIKVISAFLNPRLKYLLLDEPFDGLDPIMVEKIKAFVIKQSKTITTIITSHRMDIVDDMCDSYYILRKGQMVHHFDKTDVKNELVIKVNVEAEINSLKKLKSVLSITSKHDCHLISIINKAAFKDISRLLIEVPGYEFHRLEEKSMAQSVFEKYDV